MKESLLMTEGRTKEGTVIMERIKKGEAQKEKKRRTEEGVSNICKMALEIMMNPILCEGAVTKGEADNFLVWLMEKLEQAFEYGHHEFLPCLKALYICATFREDSSALLCLQSEFPKFKKAVWDKLMRNWNLCSCNDKGQQETFSFFLNRYVLATAEEKEFMLKILRQQLSGARAKYIKAWVKWMFAPGTPEAWHNLSDITRRFAMACASDGGGDLLLQDIRREELIEALDCMVGISDELLPALKEACERILSLDHDVRSLAEKMDSFLGLAKGSNERVTVAVFSPTFVVFDVFCAVPRVSCAGVQLTSYSDVARSIKDWMAVEYCASSASLLFKIRDINGRIQIEESL